MLKILSIGNSFSEDAQGHLYTVAKASGVELTCANLNIGGCPLHDHWRLAQSGEAAYTYQENSAVVGMRALVDTLRAETWDVVTLQQVSGLSGLYETYQPYLDDLAALVRRECPSAVLWWHKTWAYETDSQHPDFARYGSDQAAMHAAIGAAAAQACAAIGAKALPSGDVIDYLRRNEPAFNYADGGLSLCRDGFHMSLNYGRYALACTWLTTLTGAKLPDADAVAAQNGWDVDLIAAVHRGVYAVCGGEN